MTVTNLLRHYENNTVRRNETDAVCWLFCYVTTSTWLMQ